MNEEKKPCVEKLTDEEVAWVTGGTTGAARPGETNSQDKTHEFEKHDCKFCNKETVFIAYSGGLRKVCKECGQPLDGQLI